MGRWSKTGDAVAPDDFVVLVPEVQVIVVVEEGDEMGTTLSHSGGGIFLATLRCHFSCVECQKTSSYFSFLFVCWTTKQGVRGTKVVGRGNVQEVISVCMQEPEPIPYVTVVPYVYVCTYMYV